jgi:NCS1 family nucleobase:cation symporter-1
VPLAERHGKAWHLWPVWFAGDANLATLAVGVLGITLGGNLLWTSVAVVAGCALGTFFMAFHSTQGPQLGLPQMIQSRPQFGYRGRAAGMGVALIAYIGYNAFNQVLAVQALHQLLPAVAPTSASGIVLFALAALALAAIGYDTIHRAQRVFAYLMIVILSVFDRRLPAAAVAGRAMGCVGLPARAVHRAAVCRRLLPAELVDLRLRLLALPAARCRRALLVLVDLPRRFYRRRLDDAGRQRGGRERPEPGCRSGDASARPIVMPGLGACCWSAPLLGLVTISALNFYGASLTLLSVADTFRPLKSSVGKRMASLLAAAVLACALALHASGDFVNRFGDLLAVLLYLFTPWTAINLVDFYLVRRGHYSIREIFNADGMYGLWNWRGLLAYGLGFVVMIPFFSTGMYTGPVARALGGADLAMLVGLPVAGHFWLF